MRIWIYGSCRVQKCAGRCSKMYVSISSNVIASTIAEEVCTTAPVDHAVQKIAAVVEYMIATEVLDRCNIMYGSYSTPKAEVVLASV